MGGCQTQESKIVFDKTKVFEATIEYCAAVRFSKYEKFARGLILDAYPQAIVTSLKIPGISGKFDIKVK